MGEKYNSPVKNGRRPWAKPTNEMPDKRDFDGLSEISHVISALMAFLLPADQHELIPKLACVVGACKGVAEHRGKLWRDLSEVEANIVAHKAGVIAREIIGSGRARDTAASRSERRSATGRRRYGLLRPHPASCRISHSPIQGV